MLRCCLLSTYTLKNGTCNPVHQEQHLSPTWSLQLLDKSRFSIPLITIVTLWTAHQRNHQLNWLCIKRSIMIIWQLQIRQLQLGMIRKNISFPGLEQFSTFTCDGTTDDISLRLLKESNIRKCFTISFHIQSSQQCGYFFSRLHKAHSMLIKRLITPN